MLARLSLLLTTGLFLLSACDSGNELHEPSKTVDAQAVVGFVTVDLDANENAIRRREALIGNLIADALKEYSELAGLPTDIAVINSGGIRFTETNPDGIFPAGELTREDLNNMLPFSSSLSRVTVSTQQLKSIMEHSVSGLPEQTSGAFLQLSSGFSITVDLSREAQLVDENVDPNIIISEGERILSMTLLGEEIESTQELHLLVNGFMAFGGDAYVALGLLDDSARQELVDGGSVQALETFLQTRSPVTVQIEGRILYADD